jgi:hypothetical protein
MATQTLQWLAHQQIDGDTDSTMAVPGAQIIAQNDNGLGVIYTTSD